MNVCEQCDQRKWSKHWRDRIMSDLRIFLSGKVQVTKSLTPGTACPMAYIYIKGRPSNSCSKLFNTSSRALEARKRSKLRLVQGLFLELITGCLGNGGHEQIGCGQAG
jgi:hypothetical protein